MALKRIPTIVFAACLAAAAFVSAPAAAHCDGLDGPVVGAARQALAAGDPNLVLIWVQPGDEAAVRAAFQETLAVRRLGAQAQALADRYFFETVVRLHRAGEGAPYTGLQPAGRDLGPAIPMADRAVASGSVAELAAFLTEETRRQVGVRFEELQRHRGYMASDLAAGRAYIGEYVAFVHFVEGLHRALADPAEGHFPDAGEAAAHHPE
jgi:hypothetical protein